MLESEPITTTGEGRTHAGDTGRDMETDSWAAILTDDDEISQDDEAAEASLRTEIVNYLKEKRSVDLKSDPVTAPTGR